MSDTIHFITWGWLYLSLGFLFWAMIIAPLFPIGMGLWAIYTFTLLYLHQKSPKKRWQNIAYGILILILLLTMTIYVLGTWQRFTQAFPVILSGNLIGSICYWFIRKRQ